MSLEENTMINLSEILNWSIPRSCLLPSQWLGLGHRVLWMHLPWKTLPSMSYPICLWLPSMVMIKNIAKSVMMVMMMYLSWQTFILNVPHNMFLTTKYGYDKEYGRAAIWYLTWLSVGDDDHIYFTTRRPALAYLSMPEPLVNWRQVTVSQSFYF